MFLNFALMCFAGALAVICSLMNMAAGVFICVILVAVFWLLFILDNISI